MLYVVSRPPGPHSNGGSPNHEAVLTTVSSDVKFARRIAQLTASL
jgi:hypothetical protein